MLSAYSNQSPERLLFCTFEQAYSKGQIREHEKQGQFGKSVAYALIGELPLEGSVIAVSRKRLDVLTKMQSMAEMLASLGNRPAKRIFYCTEQPLEDAFAASFAIICKSAEHASVELPVTAQRVLARHFLSCEGARGRMCFDPKGKGVSQVEFSPRGILLRYTGAAMPRNPDQVRAMLVLGDELKTELEQPTSV